MSITNQVADGFMAACREPVRLEEYAVFEIHRDFDALLDERGILARADREAWRDRLDDLIAAVCSERRPS